MPDEAPWADHVVVPDDLRELQSDVDAYHRELRLARRRSRWAHVTRNRFVQRLALPAAILAGSLGLAALVFAILTFGHAGPASAPTREPLAAPTVPPVTLRGLLPDIPVRTGDTPSATGTMSIRDERPALLTLVPAHCDCIPLLDKLAGRASEWSVTLVVVAPTVPDAEVSALRGQLIGGQVQTVFDPFHALATAYNASGVTTLVVGADGTVRAIRYDVRTDSQVAPDLSLLQHPQASVAAD